jgi:hypothetical protein
LLKSDPTLKEHARATSATNRRDLLDKVVSMIQGVLLAEALPVLAGDAGAALLSAQTVILLASLFANMTEAEGRQRALDSGHLEPGRFEATRMALSGIVHPGREHIAHSTDPDSPLRYVEDRYQVIRHSLMLLPQGLIEAAGALFEAAAAVARRSGEGSASTGNVRESGSTWSSNV